MPNRIRKNKKIALYIKVQCLAQVLSKKYTRLAYLEANREILSSNARTLNELRTALAQSLKKLQAKKSKIIEKAEMLNKARSKATQEETKNQGWYLLGFALISEIGYT